METPEETFDALAEVARIRSRRAVARRKHYRKSRLDRYRAELAPPVPIWPNGCVFIAAGSTAARLTAI